MRAVIDMSLTIDLLILVPACGGLPRPAARGIAEGCIE